MLFDDDGPLLRAGRAGLEVASAGYAEQRDREKEHVTAERARLLYVAATRARDHLLVSQHYNPQRQSASFAAMLAPHLDRHPVPVLEPLTLAADAASAADHSTAAPSSPAAVEAAVDVEVDWDTLVGRDAARRATLAKASTPTVIAATRVRAEWAAPGDAAIDDAPPGDVVPAWPRGRAGTAIGRAVHAVLQHADLDDAIDLPALARAQALAEQIPEHESEIATLAARMHGSDIVRAAAARRHWREVPVAATVGGVVLEGYVDLLFEDADGRLVVVDYKTDRVDDERRLDALVASYAPQAAAYALALETTLGRSVAKAVLLFATHSGAVARDVTDLPATVADVRERLATTVAEPAALGR